MIEDDPDIEEYYWYDEDGKMHYNVTFLDDDVTHAWVRASFVQSYLKPLPRNHKIKRKYRNAYLVEDAKEKADSAIKMSIKERLQTFSFAHRYKGKWSRATDFDEQERSENIKLLIKEVQDIDYLFSSDSENETNSLVTIKENVTHEKSQKENYLSKGKKKAIDIYSSGDENFDEGLENVILNEEYFAPNKNPKEKSSIVQGKTKTSVAKPVITNPPSDDASLKNDKNNEQILHSLKTEKSTTSKPKSNSENKPQKVPKYKIDGSNKEMNKKNKNTGLEKSKKKGNLEKNDLAIIEEKNKEKPNTFSKTVKKSSFVPPVRNGTEFEKNIVYSKTPDYQKNMNNIKNDNIHKNLSVNIADDSNKKLSILANEVISDGDESKSAKPDKDKTSEKEVNSDKNLKEGLSNEILGEMQIKTEVSDEESIGIDLPEARISSKDTLENATPSKKDEKISSKNEVLKILEKNIKNSTENTSYSKSDENNLGFKTNSEIEICNTKININEKNKKSNKKAKNSTSDNKGKKEQNKEKTSIKKLENHMKENKQKKNKGKKINAVMRVTKTNPYCPVQLNKQKNEHIMDIPDAKTNHKPAIMETESISREQNDSAVSKYGYIDDKSDSLSDIKFIENREQSTKVSSLNSEGEINSYSLCLDNLDEEQSEGEDSDPFEAD